MTDLTKLKELAERATPGEWISRADGWTIRAYQDSRLAHDGIKVATTCPVFIQGQGETPDVERQVANQEFIAAASPATILALIERLERAEKDADRYRELRMITPHRFRKLQEAATTDGGDVFYFHADRFDAALDAALEGGGNG